MFSTRGADKPGSLQLSLWAQAVQMQIPCNHFLAVTNKPRNPGISMLPSADLIPVLY